MSQIESIRKLENVLDVVQVNEEMEVQLVEEIEDVTVDVDVPELIEEEVLVKMVQRISLLENFSC